MHTTQQATLIACEAGTITFFSEQLTYNLKTAKDKQPNKRLYSVLLHKI